MTDLERFQKLAEELQNMKPLKGTCPTCGRCPTCGSGAWWGTQPWGPGWHPYSPPPVWCGNGTSSDNIAYYSNSGH